MFFTGHIRRQVRLLLATNLVTSPANGSSVRNCMLGSRHPGARRRCRKMTPLLPIILVGLTAFITTVVIEAMYFVCHLWRCLFDGSALSFGWTEPLPVAGLSTVAVLLVAILAGHAVVVPIAGRRISKILDRHPFVGEAPRAS
jgi:hypothetical protein